MWTLILNSDYGYLSLKVGSFAPDQPRGRSFNSNNVKKKKATFYESEIPKFIEAFIATIFLKSFLKCSLFKIKSKTYLNKG